MIYKVTNNEYNKKNNMNKRILLVISSFLFLFSITTVSAYNITWSNEPITIPSVMTYFTNDNITELNVMYLRDEFYNDYYWYIDLQEVQVENSQAQTLLCKYDDELGTLMDGCDGIANSLSHACNDLNGTHFICMAYVSGTPNQDRLIVINKTDLGQTEQKTVTAGYYPFHALASEYRYTSVKSEDSETRMDYYDDIYTENLVMTQVYVPTAYTRFRDLAVYDDSTTGNFFLLVNTRQATGRYTPVVLIYDDNELSTQNYVTSQGIVDSDDISMNVSFPTFFRQGNSFYLSYLMGSQSIHFPDDNVTRPYYPTTVRIQAFSFSNDLFTKVWGDNVTLPNVDPSGNVNFTQSPRLYHNDITNQWWLFYTIFNSTDETPLGMYALNETIPCNCESWYNMSYDYCYGSYLEQRRICNPDGCSSGSRFVFDDYCNKTKSLEDIHLYQNIKSECETIIKTSDWLDPTDNPSVTERILEIMPLNASNIVSNATISIEVDMHSPADLGAITDRTYRTRVCNPVEECIDYTGVTCLERNVTGTVNYNNYVAGQQAESIYKVVDVGNCEIERSYWFDAGWERYRLKGIFTYCYDVYCGGWECLYEGEAVRSCMENPDCTINYTTCTRCLTGVCNADTGLCQEDTTDISQPTGDIFDWVVDESKENLSSFFLITLSIGSIAGGMLITMQQTENNWQIATGVGMLISFIFWRIGFLDTAFFILWILTVALLWSKTIYSAFKGSD